MYSTKPYAVENTEAARSASFVMPAADIYFTEGKVLPDGKVK